MCVSKPQRVLEFADGKAVVDSEGQKVVVRSPVELKPGDYVLCQAGFVAKRISREEAEEMLREWRDFNDW